MVRVLACHAKCRGFESRFSRFFYKNMPQFDFFSFFVQIFWLLVGTCLFHLIYLKMLLNNSSKAIKIRAKLKDIRLKSQEKIKGNALYERIISQWFK